MTEENIEINKIIDDGFIEEDTIHHYNFINKPWDDRDNNSKIGIITLLISIFVATIAMVIVNLSVHYREFDSASLSHVEIDCNLIKVEKYPFVARIHSTISGEMICVGVVLSLKSVLANELCLKSGPIRLQLGSPIEPRCKKGFSVDVVDPIPHDGSITKTLVLLTTFENMRDCAGIINIGVDINVQNEVRIIGRPSRGKKTISFQTATLETANLTFPEITNSLNKTNIICVRGLAKCPVRVGDLLIQGDKIYGLASTSVHRREQTKMACFANLSTIQNELQELDGNIAFS